MATQGEENYRLEVNSGAGIFSKSTTDFYRKENTYFPKVQ
jgi:hypothetical protein